MKHFSEKKYKGGSAVQDITVALASKPFVNGDIGANLTVVLATMAEGTALGADLVCFGEAFLQGFDSLCWDYAIDQTWR